MKKKLTREEILNEEFQKALNDAEAVWVNAISDLQEPEALLNYNGNPIFFKNTFVLIQGQTGCHKSRLAQAFISLLVSDDLSLNLLGFSKAIVESPNVLYLDTERNINYQLPIAIRQLLTDSGLDQFVLRSRFDVLPLANIGRMNRTEVMGKKFQAIRTGTKRHYVIVLDIVSDFLANFNDVVTSLEFTDMLNTASNGQDISFIGILHENPGGEKARGHLGTELSNKASTIFQISQTTVSNVFKVKLLKSRSTEKYEEILLKFDQTINNLIVVSDEALKLEASDPEMIKLCGVFNDTMFGTIDKEALFKFLEEKLSWKERKIHDKLSKLIDRGIEFETPLGRAILTKKRGKSTEFEIILLGNQDSNSLSES